MDEGHRLKNKEARLFKELNQLDTRHRLLLTGTPLQVGGRAAATAAPAVGRLR